MNKSIGKDIAQTSPAPHHQKSDGLANSEKTPKNQKGMAAGTFLGIDFGKSKIGLAIADEETRMAFAFDVLVNDSNFLKNFREIVFHENVKLIVIGMTRHEKDDESLREKKNFAKMLEKEIGIRIVFQEEMFTTKMAQANIKMHGGKNVAKYDDQEAARIILQEWLDNNGKKDHA